MNALVRNLLFLLVIAGAMAVVGDQASARAAQESDPPPKPSAPAKADTPAPAAKPTPTPKPTPTVDPDEQLEEFVPSEEVPADRAVAFPVDI